MQQVFRDYKKKITAFLGRFFQSTRRNLPSGARWGGDVLARLEAFATQGKMLRGGLCLLAAQMGGKRIDRQVLAVGAALELWHSALLIHDDILDRDYTRRGMPTVFAQYEALGKRKKIYDPRHFGESFGICAGDAAVFLAWQLLGTVESPVLPGLLQLLGSELAGVTYAEMQDVWLAAGGEVATTASVLELYRTKTARYTFSLPLVVGARLSGQSREAQWALEKLGEPLGILFQIKDDELGLFGDERATGKPVGADIREGKKTLFYLTLLKQATLAERRKIKTWFGNPTLSGADIAEAHALFAKYAVRSEVQEMAQDFYDQAQRQIRRLSVPANYQKILAEIAEYSLIRTK